MPCVLGPGEAKNRDRTTWIKCRGLGKHVPIFLRSDGWILNTNMTKMEAELRIKEIWSLKSLGDQRAHQLGKRKTSLPEYFRNYLKKRFNGVARKMLAFAYNFVAALEKHFIDGDFALFIKVLFSDVHEQHYYDQMMLMSNLKAHLADMVKKRERGGGV